MTIRTILFCGAFVAALAASGCATPKATDKPIAAAHAALRIGTFDSRGVALAYGRSARPDGMLAKVGEIRKRHDAAKADGNEARAKALEDEAVALQDLIHRQVFSGAPIDSILALIEDDLPKIAAAANVDLIVSDVLHCRPGLDMTDVTFAMCAPFEPDDATTKMIVELIAQPPVPASQLARDH